MLNDDPEAPDSDELVKLAAMRGYLMWLFRPVSGGIWGEVTEDATLSPEGRRAGPCPLHPIPARCEGKEGEETGHRWNTDQTRRKAVRVFGAGRCRQDRWPAIAIRVSDGFIALRRRPANCQSNRDSIVRV